MPEAVIEQPKADAAQPKPAQNEAEVEKIQRAAFEQVKSEQQARDAQGKFTEGKVTIEVAKPAEQPKTEAPKEPADKKAEPEKPKDENPVEPDPEEERAITALMRDGLTMDIIEAMPKGKMIRAGLERAKRQAKTDANYRRLRDGAGKPAPELYDEDDPEPPGDGSIIDALASTREASEAKPDNELAEVHEILDDAGKARLKAVREKDRAATQRANQERDAAVTMAIQERVQGLRGELVREFPALDTPEGFQAMLERMQAIEPTAETLYRGTRGATRELMRNAAALAFRSTSTQQARDEAIKANRDLRNGQVDTRTSASAPTVERKTVDTETYQRYAAQEVGEFPSDYGKAQKRLEDLVAAHAG